MQATAPIVAVEREESSAPYVVPFVVFIGFLALQYYRPIPSQIDLPLRLLVMIAVIAIFSRRVLTFHCSQAAASVLLGVAVFAVWVAPDLLWPAYRQSVLFRNSLLGGAGAASIDASVLTSPLMLALRTARAVIIVPIIEELFWRAWMLRWIRSPHFSRLPLGSTTPSAFWITALLFASEHGPFWDVGLIAGAVYNWWMVRTRSLGDCILAHAVTNACLCAFVIVTHRWQYWM